MLVGVAVLDGCIWIVKLCRYPIALFTVQSIQRHSVLCMAKQ